MTQERAARFDRTGGPEVIAWHDVDLPEPGPGEVRMRNTAVGLNYIDTYHRGGLYPVALPSGLGVEAAGVVEAVGEGVDLPVGTRVGTFGPALGAYATARNLPADALIPLPAAIDDRTAAAAMLKGFTAEFLAERAAQPKAGEWALVHAAAGGVGLLLVQWLRHLGVGVIGTVSSQAKAAAATEAGADHIVRYDHEDVAQRVHALTGGEGVRVTYDGVGGATWAASLAATGRRGTIVSFGNAGGAVTGVNLGVLAQKGSLYVTRPTLFDYYREAGERTAGAKRVWDLIADGVLKVTVGQTYALEDAARAHADLEARRTTGSTLLLPSYTSAARARTRR